MKTGASGEYFDPRSMRMGSGEDSTMSNFIVCTVYLIRSGKLRWACHVTRMEESRSAFEILTGRPKPTGKRYLGKPRRRWE